MMIFNIFSQTGTTAPNPLTSLFVILLPFLVMIAFLYFLFIRPQQKEEKERIKMINSLKKGDRVVTLGGIIGTVVRVDESAITLRTGSGTLIKFEKNAVKRRLKEAGEGEKGS